MNGTERSKLPLHLLPQQLRPVLFPAVVQRPLAVGESCLQPAMAVRCGRAGRQLARYTLEPATVVHPAVLTCLFADSCSLFLIWKLSEPSLGSDIGLEEHLHPVALVHRAAERSNAGGSLLARGRVVELGVRRVPGPQLRLPLPIRVAERQLHGARHHALPQARHQRLARLHWHTASGVQYARGCVALVQQSTNTPVEMETFLLSKKMLCYLLCNRRCSRASDLPPVETCESRHRRGSTDAPRWRRAARPAAAGAASGAPARPAPGPAACASPTAAAAPRGRCPSPV
jgi:hypothetical protein